jgi:hypothetical protein
VLKLSLLFHLAAFLVTLFAGIGLWAVAVNAGATGDVEGFIREAFALKSFTFDGDRIFQAAVLGGLSLVVAATTLTVLLAALFNLMSDVVGGVRLTVLEEVAAQPLRSRKAAGTAEGEPRVAAAVGSAGPIRSTSSVAAS